MKKWFYPFLFALVAGGSIFAVTDNDVWWHLKTGEYIIRSHSIPTVDIFSYTIAGRPWLAFEWLAQALLHLVYTAAGLSGLTLFKAAVVAAVFLLLLRSVRDEEPLAAFPLLAAGFLAMRDGLRERPQLFTYLFAAVYGYIFRMKKERAWLIPILQVFWANMHGPASVIGVALAAVYVPFEPSFSRNRKSALLVLTAAATFVTPHGWDIFRYFYVFFREGFNKLILEYQSPVFSPVFAAYFVLVLLSLVVIVRWFERFVALKERPDARDALALALGLAASFAAIRNIPVFAVIALPVLINEFSKIQRNVVRKGLSFRSPAAAAAAGAVMLSAFWFAGSALDTSGKYAFGTGDAHRARGAAAFLARARVKGPVFNDYDLGGYMIWKLWPEYRVFVDGRLVEYGAKFVEDSFYFWKPEIWGRLDKEYGFSAAVIPQESFYACGNIDRLKEWALVYWDDGALVYLKDVPANRKLIKLFGYRCIKPNYPGSLDYLKSYPYPAVRREVFRSAYFAPQSARARAMKEWILRTSSKE